MLGRRPRQLSGGQRQRVAMGRAIVREPAIFLMDEPLSNLDAKLRVQMRAEVLRVHRRIGAATLYVTHDQTEAMTMGDRVAVLRDGILQQAGMPRELYDRPANIFVATFMGSPSMSLYEAGLEITGEAAELVLGHQRLSLPEKVLKRVSGLGAHHGGSVIVGIRPESLADPETAGTAPEPGTTLTVDVQLVEVLGSEQLVHFRLDAQRVREEAELRGQLSVAQDPSAADVAAPAVEVESQGEIVAATVASGVARIDPRAAVRPHAPAVLAVDIERLHFFDPATGMAIS
jgi:multiple sugar transport system ATP-binding protein